MILPVMGTDSILQTCIGSMSATILSDSVSFQAGAYTQRSKRNKQLDVHTCFMCLTYHYGAGIGHQSLFLGTEEELIR